MRLRVVGGLGRLAPYIRHERPFWAELLPARSAGRVQAEIVPFERSGIRAQEALRLLQLGVIPFGTVSLAASASQYPELGAPDLAGLNADLPAARVAVGAFRPHLQRLLKDRFGIELLAVYASPAQVLFCKRPFNGLADMRGRRIRTSNVSQSDLVEALGASAVPTAFGDIMDHMRSGTTDCAITGAMSGNVVGLHEVTSHLHTLPLSWGLSIFAANGAAWAALPSDVKLLLRDEIPRLEAAIWAEAERETADGPACNTGTGGCEPGRRGAMAEVRATPQDDQLRRQVFASTVLDRWLQRCGQACARAWDQTLGPVTGITAAAR